MGGLISADRLFGLLERDYPVGEIEKAVAAALRPSADVDLTAHKVLLDLSRSPAGQIRLATTNFDLLFEACDPSLPRSRPPRLPDPSRTEEMIGVIHLHGHVDDGYTGAEGDGFVLSSSEFGRAYLSEGWATSFIRSVLDRYTVVFVGYTADDPPVQYLLEALNRSSSSPAELYAFQAGADDVAQAKWRHKGVHAISYDPEPGHKALWDTLEAWAARARDPEAWSDGVIAMAQRGPADLEPHERGMVTHLVSTVEGARKFATAEKPPPAEWLCVFDRTCRFATPGQMGPLGTDRTFVDPFALYGLDSDAIPAPIDPEDVFSKREAPANAWDGFFHSRLDRLNATDQKFSSLRGHFSTNVPSLVSRHHQIGAWIARVADQPATVWWAAGQSGLHPNTRFRIRRELERRERGSSSVVRKAWRALFEVWDSDIGSPQRGWYELKATIALDGWTNSALREFASIHRPYLKASRPTFTRPIPPNSVADCSLQDLVDLSVEYPRFRGDVDIPHQCLARVLRNLASNLELAIDLEAETGKGFMSLCPIEPDENLEGDASSRDIGLSSYVLFFCQQYRRLVQVDREAARREFFSWRQDDPEVFARLRIWVAGDPRVLTSAECGRVLWSLDDEVFWGLRHQRDLLLVLARRWGDLSTANRKAIERRLLGGQPRWSYEDEAGHKQRQAWESLTRLHWLSSQGCEFTFDLSQASEALKQAAPDWTDASAAHAADTTEARGGWVQTNTDFTELLSVPLSGLLDTAQALRARQAGTLVQNEPFMGLVAARPVKAFGALTLAARAGDYPAWAWHDFLYAEARKEDRPRLIVQISERMARIPPSDLAELLRMAARWLSVVAKTLLDVHPDSFGSCWRAIIGAIEVSPSQAGSSVIRQNEPPDWVSEAINSPVGDLAKALMRDPAVGNLESGQGFPAKWKSRVEALLSLPGDARCHALTIFMHNLNWFFAIDPQWTETNLNSALEEKGDRGDAAWSGFFWGAGRGAPDGQLYSRLKPLLLALISDSKLKRRRDAEVLSAVLLSGWGSRDEATGERYVTDAEMHDALVNGDDDFRTHTIWYLQRWSDGNENGRWDGKAEVFLSDAWPKHNKAKSGVVSARLCEFAFAQKKRFAEIAEIILPMLTPVRGDRLDLLYLIDRDESVVSDHPKQTLALLYAVLPDDVTGWPYGGDGLLNRIQEADPSLKTDTRMIELRRRWASR